MTFQAVPMRSRGQRLWLFLFLLGHQVVLVQKDGPRKYLPMNRGKVDDDSRSAKAVAEHLLTGRFARSTTACWKLILVVSWQPDPVVSTRG